jgi:hypothetical protein
MKVDSVQKERTVPFKSKSQMRGAFSGAFGPEMKARAHHWASLTPNISKLPERKLGKEKKGKK